MTVTSGPQELCPFRPFSAFKERTCLLRLVRQVRQVRQALHLARVRSPTREARGIAIVYAAIAVGTRRKKGGDWADRDWDRRGRSHNRRETVSHSRSRSRSYNRNRSDSRSLSRYRNRSRSSSRDSTRSTEQARPTDQVSNQGTAPPPAAVQEDGELIIADANPPPLDQEPLLPKSFRLDKARSKELRSWMTSAQKPTEAKQLRENFHPSFEKGSFDLKVPVLDPSMARRLKEVRGGEASKAEAKEKALVASQFKILDIGFGHC